MMPSSADATVNKTKPVPTLQGLIVWLTQQSQQKADKYSDGEDIGFTVAVK